MASAPVLKSLSLGDILAGISVALVVIPQSLAYAELAGMPAYTGLLAAALPSVTAALFVASPYLQTGPVALTSLLTFGVLSQLATPGTASYMSLAASLALFVGMFRLLIGVLRFGSLAGLVCQPVLL
jgi:SulP family sulfate permease